MKRTIRTVLLSSLVLAAAGCGNGKGNGGDAAVDAAEDSALLIDTVKVSSMDVPQTEVYSSTVEANAVNNIAPQSSLRIQKINVEVGDYVTRGQILAELDQVQTIQAKLRYVNDSTEFGRISQLYSEGGISKSDYDAAELSYEVSRTNYQNLLENSVLRSPLTGVVTARNYDRGDMYSMGTPLYVVQEVTPVKILVGITESDYTKVHKGDAVSITTDAIPGRTFSGKINRIYPTVDPSSHTFTVEVIVPNGDRALRPGMYAKVEVTFGINHSVVAPDEAIVKQQGSGQRFVYILQNDGSVKASLVTLGRHLDDSYEILSGLGDGDVVATNGSANLKDGSKVRIGAGE